MSYDLFLKMIKESQPCCDTARILPIFSIFKGILHCNNKTSVFLWVKFEDLNPNLAQEEATCVCSCALQLDPDGRYE